ncbi:transposase [Thalassotalea mangrovi]|uniref:Transposase n=1 Tax=Thalassotalea mangrovi TaxID=2572245 RepID=A0A4U1B7C0_9GAMM|nr:transposase [Thalassotalea mangrovi]
MPTPRNKQVCLQATSYYHCISRCVRRAYLCGRDKYSNKSYEHRRGWIEKRLLFLSSVFCIDICAYAVMKNHCHVVIHIDQEKAASLTDMQVVRLWHQVCKGTILTRQFSDEGEVADYLLPTLKNTISVYRERLFDISWFMRLLNEPIARMANDEDDCTGRFWEGRFVSQALLDEAALAACMVYVELNPIRAGAAKTPENSPYTSVKRRIEIARRGDKRLGLMQFSEKSTIHQSGKLPFEFEDYLQLIDATGRVIRDENTGYINRHLPDILTRLRISTSNWLSLTTRFERYFKGAAGRCSSLSQLSEIQNTKRRINVCVSKRLFQ